MHIYKTYDQKALNDQYNNRARVADFSALVRQWDYRSKRLRQDVRAFLNIAYGSGRREELDIFPSGKDSAIQVFFHGGYWMAMDKQLFHFVAKGFLSDDVTTVIVNYPLAPNDTMDDIVGSCRQAVIWLYRHAASYGADRNRIFLSGHSAGAHLVAMLMATRWKAFGEDLPDDLVKAGCAISGLFDLTPIRLSYLNDTLKLDLETVKRNSPILLSITNGNSLILAVGECESDEYHAQSRAFATAWSKKQFPVKQVIVCGADHFSILDALVDRTSTLYRQILRQLTMTS